MHDEARRRLRAQLTRGGGRGRLGLPRRTGAEHEPPGDEQRRDQEKSADDCAPA
jgi:hypothetical protein